MLPFALIMKSVVSDPPPAEVEETAKSDAKFVVDVACTERSAKGDVVPTPSFPAKSPFAKCEVEEAKRPAVANRGVEVAEVLTPKFSVGVNGKAAERLAEVR